MKKIFILLITVAMLFAGCSISEQKPQSNNTQTDYIKSVWMTYIELEKFTTENETADDF